MGSMLVLTVSGLVLVRYGGSSQDDSDADPEGSSAGVHARPFDRAAAGQAAQASGESTCEDLVSTTVTRSTAIA